MLKRATIDELSEALTWPDSAEEAWQTICHCYDLKNGGEPVA